MSSLETLLTVEDVAAALAITPDQVRRLVWQRELTAYRLAGTYRFTRQQLEDFLNSHLVTGDVSPDNERAALAPKRRRAVGMLVADLVTQGALLPGDEIVIRDHDGDAAVVHDGRLVRYRGREQTYHQWAKQATGWQAVNVYDWAVQRRTGKTLGQLRNELLQQRAGEGQR